MAGNKSELEIELKIRISKDNLEKVFNKMQKKALNGAIKHKYRPRDYFDTKGKILYKNNIGLRVQYKEGKGIFLGGYEQTVKHAAGIDNVEIGSSLDKALSRKECKDFILTETPDIKSITDPVAKKLLQDIKNEDLIHLFSSHVERRYFVIEVENKKGKGLIELAFDIGKIKLAPPNDGEYIEVSEIEVELKKGDPSLINTVKKQIKEIVPNIKIEEKSKAELGYKIYNKFEDFIEKQRIAMKKLNDRLNKKNKSPSNKH